MILDDDIYDTLTENGDLSMSIDGDGQQESEEVRVLFNSEGRIRSEIEITVYGLEKMKRLIEDALPVLYRHQERQEGRGSLCS